MGKTNLIDGNKLSVELLIYFPNLRDLDPSNIFLISYLKKAFNETQGFLEEKQIQRFQKQGIKKLENRFTRCR